MENDTLTKLQSGIRDVMDFPKPGILFKDITPLLADPGLFKLSLDALEETMLGQHVDKLVAIDARGFIFAGALAERLGAGLVPVRKKGKLPFRTKAVSYDLEYGSATVEIHEDALHPGESVWLVDDVLATGGTSGAAANLVKLLGARLVGMTFLIELDFLGGRKVLPQDVPVFSVVRYA
ncbi:MAG: adenine phosphoribosyltransferase [Verrucomicrobiales bacterium]|nr:adenine phosphoribosyltransferase [Verrucomicrobiales bacterium]